MCDLNVTTSDFVFFILNFYSSLGFSVSDIVTLYFVFKWSIWLNEVRGTINRS